MKLPSQTISQSEAESQGYRPLTVQYLLPKERAMLDSVQRDLAGIDFQLVGSQDSPEIWRKGLIEAKTGAVHIPYSPRGASRPLTV